MSTTFPTLSTDPPSHTAMDYAALRAEGLTLLGKLTGGQWTDFNTHDPGITLLEQLCFAITDLGYRSNYPVADLISSTAGMPGPHQILCGDPVTQTDLRKTLTDLGLGAVRIGTAEGLPFYYHPGSKEIRLVADPGAPDGAPVPLQGVSEVRVQTTDSLSGDAALLAVSTRLHGVRPAGEDWEIGLLSSFEVWVNASVEVGPVEDPADLLAELMEQIQDYLSPLPRFRTRADLPDARADDLYQGPLLEHGFLLELPELRKTIYTSDLLHVLTDVSRVRAVRSVTLSRSSSGPEEQWVLQVPASAVPRLAVGSKIVLLRAGLPLKVDPQQVQKAWARRRLAKAMVLGTEAAPTPPTGRDRNLTRYHSVQRHLPAAYGVGLLGLPSSAPVLRRAQALQLQAYLLIFDQLLTNSIAQLAHAGQLLSPEGDVRSYFAQPVDDAPLQFDHLLNLSPEKFKTWLESAVETGDPLERRQRFLAHLLARFGEELGDHARIGPDVTANQSAEIVSERQAFLQAISEVGGTRGSGFDLLEDEEGGLARRVRLKLGSRATRQFLLIEHILLRPVTEDKAQLVDEGEGQIPLLAGVDSEDPWSLQLSFVFQEQARATDSDKQKELDDYETFVGQLLLSETPAHLRPILRWFGDQDGTDHWALLKNAWADFRQKLKSYRAAALGGATVSALIHLPFRDTRDQVADLLTIGRSYPLRDIPLPTHLIVAPGTPTEIELGYSQTSVTYVLCNHDTGKPVESTIELASSKAIGLSSKVISAVGTGRALILPTPPILDDVNYRILAVKTDGATTTQRRETWLRGVVRVEEGVDPRLVTQIRQPLLVTSDTTRPSDARIADYGAEILVEILESQEGVVYELIDDKEAELSFSAQKPVSKASVVGTSGTIVLSYPKATEDLDLRVRGKKEVGDPQKPEYRTAVLDQVMPLRVRANPAISMALTASILDVGSAGTVELQATQTSATYQSSVRTIRDSEFVFDGSTALEVSDNGRLIRLRAPDTLNHSNNGENKPGTGAKLSLKLNVVDRDVYVLVTATKQHRIDPLRATNLRTVSTSVSITQRAALLLRPDANIPLLVQSTGSNWTFSNGQPGVYYSFQGKSLFVPVYFQQRDDQNSATNKGIGQIRMQVDLVLTANNSTPTSSLVDPSLPALGENVTVIARKAMSSLSNTLTRTLPLPAAVRAEPTKVSTGKSGTIRVSSVLNEQYALRRDGAVLSTQLGTGNELSFDTGVLTQTTNFEVAMTRDGVLERRVLVTVGV